MSYERRHCCASRLANTKALQLLSPCISFRTGYRKLLLSARGIKNQDCYFKMGKIFQHGKIECLKICR